MKKFILLVIAALAAFSSCSVSRRVSVSAEDRTSWVGFNTVDILDAMGTPGRIDTDGKGGSILVYESAPGYDDPSYDILDPDASPRNREYAYFYLDEEGTCYRVDSNRNLPATPRVAYSDGSHFGFWLDLLVFLPLILLL